MKSKVFTIKIESFNTRVQFIIAPTMFKCGKILRKKYPEISFPEELDFNGLYLNNIKNYKRVILLEDSKNILPIAVHEIYHFIFQMLRDKGIDPSEETEEVFAYLLQYMTKKFIKNYEK